jgi:hypothetical protein
MQFFQQYHYAAFEPPKPTLDDDVTRQERIRVRESLLQLDEILWPFINTSNWDLHRHRQAVHYVSSDHFIYMDDGKAIVNNIDGMWLHYGKSQEQLDFLKLIGGYDYKKIHDEDFYNAFYLHTRIQFYINANVFRCWLLLATDKNYYDRSEFLRKISSRQEERDRLYKLIQPLLGKGFFYEIHDQILELNQNLTQKELINFVRKDRAGIYSGIVKEYKPDDSRLSLNCIGTEMISNLELFFPIYDFMACRRQA